MLLEVTMLNLADKVIKANEEDTLKQGPKLDDIGFPLPKPDTERAWCEYLTARFLYLNPYTYVYHSKLWIDNEIIEESATSYYTLAKYPKRLSEPECRYVWRRLKEVCPTLNTDIIEVLPGVTFNMRTGEFGYDDVQPTRPWKEKNDSYKINQRRIL